MITSTQSEASITPLARNSDPITSHEAADAAQAMRKHHHSAIMACLSHVGAMGKDGIASFTKLEGVQVARRLPELAALGLARTTGRKVRSDTGRMEREWEAV